VEYNRLTLTSHSRSARAMPMRFPVVATQVSVAMPSTLVKASAAGVGCPEKGSRYGDYRKAMDHALSDAPGANASINVELRTLRRGFIPKLCVEVGGDAVRF